MSLGENHVPALPEQPWSRSCKDVAEELHSFPGKGIGEKEIKARMRQYGPNRLREKSHKSAWIILFDQIKNPIVLLLVTAAVIAFIFGQGLEGISILIAVLINAAIGFFTEWRAVRSMEALKEMSLVTARVKRGDKALEIPSPELVPGDLVLLDAGDVVSADLRLLEASRLNINESALTGESVPVSKQTEPLEAETPLAQRTNMAFKGTSVTSGSGKGLVTATGMSTELGGIASLAEEAQAEETPLEKRLAHLGYRLLWVTLGIASTLIFLGFMADKPLLLIVETSIALAVAAIPEGLPIVATLALARGMWRMARHNAVINRLAAVETLGATGVIFTDKTGTLTENLLKVTRLDIPGREAGRAETIIVDQDKGGFYDGEENPVSFSEYPALRRMLEVGVLCNNADLQSRTSEGVGDPLELALLHVGYTAGIKRGEMLEEYYPEVREHAFDPQRMMMATVHRLEEGLLIAVKGAPEAILNACSKIEVMDGEPVNLESSHRKMWLEQNNSMAETGLRVLGAAYKEVTEDDDDPYSNLIFLGLFGFMDPPRKNIQQAIDRCRQAGIRVIMVTGDQATTARKIAEKLGVLRDGVKAVIEGKDLKDPDELSESERRKLLQVRVFARVNPEQKLHLIRLHQDRKTVVAMTGDGVNDAPALKKADIGVAMGRRGTQVAKEAADMILKDDSFQTILVAVEQGRAIFHNIRRFILFLLSGNVAEIMIVAVAILIGFPLPILPLQILYLNLIGDVFPAFALATGRGDGVRMDEPARDPGEPILTNRHWGLIGGYGAVLAVCVLSAFWLAFKKLGLEGSSAVTVSFLTLAFARLWHVFNMRESDIPIFVNDITRNLFVWGALALCTVLLIIAVMVPDLAMVLKLSRPDFFGWLVIFGMSLVPLIIIQPVKVFAAHKRK